MRIVLSHSNEAVSVEVDQRLLIGDVVTLHAGTYEAAYQGKDAYFQVNRQYQVVSQFPNLCDKDGNPVFWYEVL